MKRYLLLFLFVFKSILGFTQIQNPVKWSFSSEPISDKEAFIVIKAVIEPGWHVYSQFIDEGGPIPTSFKFAKSTDYKLIGKVTESPKAVTAFDPNFNMQIAWHEKQVVFKQKLAITKSKLKITGVLEFMVCDDVQCLPPDEIEFSVNIKTDGTNQANISDNDTPIATKDSLKVTMDSIKPVASVDTVKNKIADLNNVKVLIEKEESKSLWAIFLAGFLGGFLALIMPCIFPMLPLTVSYFTKKAGSKRKAVGNAVIYGLSIIVIYVALGIMVTLFFGSDALNELASNGVFNFLFFVLLVIFAISFLGAFDINLPNNWINKVDEQSDKKGLLGLFFMAFALALVSFSCTGPIIGTLLVQAASTGKLMGPAAGMFGFSLALAIPFTLFAAFPSLLKSLPKSGGWLNSVKVVLGFLELALAFKFLSNVDLAYHWDLLDREVFLVLWIVIFAMMGFYIIGKLTFSHDSPLPFITVPRILLSIIIFSFTLYMVPGLWGAPLKALSGFLPPQTTQDFDLYNNSSLNSLSSNDITINKKYSGLFKAPHNLNAFFDLQQGLAYAKENNKPVLIDFTGHSCVNCRKMEASVWGDPEVLNLLKNDFVLISLYVDDKTELPDNEKYTSKFSGKKIKTIGNKWSDYQASTFKTNSQPFYIIADFTGEALLPPTAFDLNILNYISFLNKGKVAFEKKYKR